MNTVWIRRIVSMALFLASMLVFASGAILFLKTTNVLYRVVDWVPTNIVDEVHTYAGFVISGLAVIHIYLNWPTLKSYFKLLKR